MDDSRLESKGSAGEVPSFRRSFRPMICAAFMILASCGVGDSGSSLPDMPTTTPVNASTSLAPALDLVVVGDSFVGWSDWPEMYASFAAEALGVSVVVDESLAGPGTPRRLDQLLRSDSARDVIASAEILVVQPQPGWAAGPAFNDYFAGECGGDDNTDCLESLAVAFGSYAAEYFDLLLDLAPPGTIIRVVSTASWAPEGYYPNLREDDPESLARLTAAVVSMMQESERAAAERGIPTIDVGAAFNGPDYQQPAPEGYLVPDRLHLDHRGSEIVAELLHELGYEATVSD